MRNDLVPISALPILACLRDARGKILAVTDKLLEVEQLRAGDIVGRHVTDVWPHAKAWLELDRLALRARRPLVRIEHSDRLGWLRSTRAPIGRRVLWTGEDVTGAVKLGAVRSLATISPQAFTLLGRESSFAVDLLAGRPADEVAAGHDMTFEQAVGACMRLLSR